MRRVCVYCGSSRRAKPVYIEAARQLGAILAGRGIGLVYGGSTTGLMGTLADTVMQLGGEVIGIIPDTFKVEIAHQGISELRIVASMHERKAQMIELSDALVALPGAYGTLDEFCEALAWSQLGLHNKPCGLLNTNSYYDLLLRFLDHAVGENFMGTRHRGLIIEDSDPVRLLDRLAESHRAEAG